MLANISINRETLIKGTNMIFFKESYSVSLYLLLWLFFFIYLFVFGHFRAAPVAHGSS